MGKYIWPASPGGSQSFEVGDVARLLTGPWGLLAQFAAAGYILAAFALYPWRHRFFHPDVINVRGALAGVLVWAVVEAVSWHRGGGLLGAVPALGPLLAIPAAASILGRAHWILVARRAAGRRDSLTKWEYKTRASAAAIVAIAAGLGGLATPVLAAIAVAVAAAAIVLRAGRSRTPRLRRPAGRDRHEIHAGDGAAISPLRDGELLVDADLSTRAAAGALAGQLLRRCATRENAGPTTDRILVCVGSVRSGAEPRAAAGGESVLARIRAGALDAGLSATSEPILQAVSADESLGLRAVVLVDPTDAVGDDTFDRCARAISSAAPELAEVLVCIEA